MPYMIRNKKTGHFATAGMGWVKNGGKIWTQIGHAKNAMANHREYDSRGRQLIRTIPEDWEVVEVEMKVVRRASAKHVAGGDLCVNCGRSQKEHAKKVKCLTEPTDYKLWEAV